MHKSYIAVNIRNSQCMRRDIKNISQCIQIVFFWTAGTSAENEGLAVQIAESREDIQLLKESKEQAVRDKKAAEKRAETDMYPFYWTSSERGIFMRYTYEFKKKAVELYRQGKWIDAPNDIINLKNFHDMIVRWHHLEESNTSDCLKHCGTNKKWSPEEKYELVARVIAGDTITSVAYTVGINSGLLAQWIRKYKIWGYNGLVDRRKGRKPKESAMKKMNINNPRKLNESEYEELIRLRAEITYIKAENEVIKKEIALREEREAALLKAKKQQSSKNSKKKDIC